LRCVADDAHDAMCMRPVCRPATGPPLHVRTKLPWSCRRVPDALLVALFSILSQQRQDPLTANQCCLDVCASSDSDPPAEGICQFAGTSHTENPLGAIVNLGVCRRSSKVARTLFLGVVNENFNLGQVGVNNDEFADDDRDLMCIVAVVRTETETETVPKRRSIIPPTSVRRGVKRIAQGSRDAQSHASSETLRRVPQYAHVWTELCGRESIEAAVKEYAACLVHDVSHVWHDLARLVITLMSSDTA